MKTKSRTKKSIVNARMNLICYFLTLVVAFFTRKTLLDYLGTEFLGLTGTLGSLLSFLNLAELGIGSAIAYVLYKPLFECDESKINEIISVLGYLYRKIGSFILLAGLLLSAFLPWIFSNTEIPLSVIYTGFYCYLVSSMFGYFISYKITILSADQRNYIVTGFFQLITTIKVILQMTLAYYTRNFYLYFAVELISGLLLSLLLNHKVYRCYPWLQTDVRTGRELYKEYPEIGKYIKQLFFHKIGGFVQGQVLPILIYAFVSLPMVALYTNYTLITQRVQGLLDGILNSTNAGVGSLISEGNQEKIWINYRLLFSLRMLTSGIFSFCTSYMFSSFISLWLGQEYILPDTVVYLIVILMFLQLSRGINEQFLFGYGLFYDVWAPLVESALFILLSIVFGAIYGLTGVLAGPIGATLIIVHGWKPYFLFTKGLIRPIVSYLKLLLVHLCLTIVGYIGSLKVMEYFLPMIDGLHKWVYWITQASLFTVIISCFTITLYYITLSHFRAFVYRIVKIKFP